MKKIFTPFSFVVVCVAVAMAQNITFSFGGNNYAKQDTMPTTLAPGYMVELHGISMINNAARPVTLRVSCTALNPASNIEVAGICTVGGQCSSGSISNAFDIAANEECSDFHILMNVPDNLPQGTIESFLLVAFSGEAPDTTVNPYTFVNVSVDDIGITPVQCAKLTLYPNPTTESLYVETANNEGQVVIYDIQGRNVFTQPVSSNQTVQLPLSNLAAGNYICTLQNQGRIVASNSFVMKH